MFKAGFDSILGAGGNWSGNGFDGRGGCGRSGSPGGAGNGGDGVDGDTAAGGGVETAGSQRAMCDSMNVSAQARLIARTPGLIEFYPTPVRNRLFG
jgi:hypothetical protein